MTLLASPPVAAVDDDPPRAGFCGDIRNVPGEWFVAQAKFRSDKLLAHALFARGVAYYLPMGERVTDSGRKSRVTLCPLFTPYVFFASETGDASEVFDTQRVLKIIPVVNQLRLVRELANVERALEANPRIETCEWAIAGRKCKVASGKLWGVEGTVISRGKGAMMIIEVNGFGRAMMEIDGGLLEPVDD